MGMTGRIATTLIARRRPHGGPGEMHRDAVAVGCPAWTLCGAAGAAGGFGLHNAMPARPGGLLVFHVLGALTRGLPLPLSLPRTLLLPLPLPRVEKSATIAHRRMYPWD